MASDFSYIITTVSNFIMSQVWLSYFSDRTFPSNCYWTMTLAKSHFDVIFRVTRWVWEKIAQNVAQAIICQNKYLHNSAVEKSGPKIWATSVIKKIPKVNNHPIGENSPNLFTLVTLQMSK
jgi:hypothetical protein